MKTFSLKTDALTGEEYLEVYLRGQQVLSDPFLNKGSVFTEEERIHIELEGLLRTNISTIEQQRARSYEMFSRKQDDLEKFIYLQALLNRNETLFYSLLCEHLTEMLPIVYTPTVGQACLQLSHITREYRGIYINPDNIGSIDKIFHGISQPEVYLIVVTDGERILGLGDLGSDGMGIPIGKINLYVAAGGIHPACCLPISLDVGTNNQNLLDDPLYLGYRGKRLDGKEYDQFIERFVLGVKRVFPHALLQWEDFAKNKAFKLLERYRNRILSFNDDIQGTGSCTLAALMSAMKIKKQRFNDQRFVIAGLGQAGCGIANNILNMLKEEGASEKEAKSRIFAYDFCGLLMEESPGITEYQKSFAQPRSAISNWELEDSKSISLKEIIKNSKASVLIGVTAMKGLFSREIICQMAANTERPVILSLSNPTSKSECTPEDVITITNGKGIVATGSPFAPVEFNGKKHYSSQCNNMFIFPGVGLGVLVARATKVTTKMFLESSKALSELVTEEELKNDMLLPNINNIREVSFHVAKAVAVEARESGLGRILSDEQLSYLIKKAQWQPRYYPYRPGKQNL